MGFYCVHRRLAAWLAMLAMVMGALSPTLAHAWVAASGDEQWIEVCSASGMVWLKTDGSDATGQGRQGQSLRRVQSPRCCDRLAAGYGLGGVERSRHCWVLLCGL